MEIYWDILYDFRHVIDDKLYSAYFLDRRCMGAIYDNNEDFDHMAKLVKKIKDKIKANTPDAITELKYDIINFDRDFVHLFAQLLDLAIKINNIEALNFLVDYANWKYINILECLSYNRNLINHADKIIKRFEISSWALYELSSIDPKIFKIIMEGRPNIYSDDITEFMALWMANISSGNIEDYVDTAIEYGYKFNIFALIPAGILRSPTYNNSIYMCRLLAQLFDKTNKDYNHPIIKFVLERMYLINNSEITMFLLKLIDNPNIRVDSGDSGKLYIMDMIASRERDTVFLNMADMGFKYEKENTKQAIINAVTKMIDRGSLIDLLKNYKNISIEFYEKAMDAESKFFLLIKSRGFKQIDRHRTPELLSYINVANSRKNLRILKIYLDLIQNSPVNRVGHSDIMNDVLIINSSDYPNIPAGIFEKIEIPKPPGKIKIVY